MQVEARGEVMVALTSHENKIDEIFHRLKAQEQQTKAINELSLSVRELAVTMKGMISEQKSLGERITRLERAPLAKYEKVLFAIFSALLGAVSAIVTTLI